MSNDSERFLSGYVAVALPIIEKLQRLRTQTQPGQYGCKQCGHIAERAAFALGRGREHGQHPEHKYCPECGQSITWAGYYCGDRLAANKVRTQEVA